MILEVRRGLGEQSSGSDDFWTNGEITDWLNEGLQILVSDTQMLQGRYQFTTVANQQEYVLSPDIDEIYGVFHSDSRNDPLKLTDQFSAQQGSATTGRPTHYYLSALANQTSGMSTSTSQPTIAQVNLQNASEFRLVMGLSPIPSAAKVITVFHFARHQRMRNLYDVPAIPIEFHRGPISYAKAMGKEKDDAFAEKDKYLQEFSEFRQRLKDKAINQGQVNAAPRMRMSDDYGEYGAEPTVIYLTELS